MRLREHTAIQPGALDIFRADPRHLVEQEGYNVRDLTTPEAQEKLRELAESIAEVGVTDPLVVRFDGEQIIVVEGHRRLMATLMAIDAGAEIKSVPIYQEARGVNDAQRDLGLIVSNSGEPLTPLEKAKVIGRLVAHGWSHQDISKKCGWKSPASVLQYLDMLAMPEAVKEHVRQGDISATTARQLAKSELSPEQQVELLRKNKEENARIKGKNKSHKVTAKTLKRGKADKLPVPERVQRQSEIAPLAVQEAQQTYEKTLASAQAGNIDALNKIPFDAEAFRSAAKDAFIPPLPRQQPPSLAKKDLIAALAPFAKIVPDFDPECPDEHVILISDLGHEITAGQCRTAWRVWNAATGGSSEAEAA